jgi:hypothetical protein
VWKLKNITACVNTPLDGGGELRRSAAEDAALPRESALLRGGNLAPHFLLSWQKKMGRQRWKRKPLQVSLLQTFGASSRRESTHSLSSGAENRIVSAPIPAGAYRDFPGSA